MVDYHTHILPGMDDGAKTVEESLKMLEMESEQAVSSVVLTPHFYPDGENITSFLRRRKESFDVLKRAAEKHPEHSSLPALYLGAETAWVMNIERMPQLEKLCCEDTEYLLLELPMRPWDSMIFRSLDELIRLRKIIPVIAHIDRYFRLQKKEQIRELLELRVPVQISTSSFLHRNSLRRASVFAAACGECFLASDCHNTETRKPNMGYAVTAAERKLDIKTVERMLYYADHLLKDGT